MRIYLSHSSSMEYRTELYQPIRSSGLNAKHEIILPHEESGEPLSSRELITSCELVIADVSEKSTGSGIELGWADASGVPVVCIYKEGSNFSPAIKLVAKTFVAYRDASTLINAFESIIADNPPAKLQ